MPAIGVDDSMIRRFRSSACRPVPPFTTVGWDDLGKSSPIRHLAKNAEMEANPRFVSQEKNQIFRLSTHAGGAKQGDKGRVLAVNH